ncbi:MAG TPA: ribonuclease HI family protein [Candidatus Angelobacter sp.]|jgi:probable phosphoglycerate mutase|nr:ribonuclease HI family protein [Candidatus Angelobacter sp.]
MTQSSLFSDAPTPRSSGFEVIANVDGGARGNPGPSAYGVVVRDAQGKVVAELSRYLGIQTNNYAEYSGLLAALEYAAHAKYESIKVISDSELLVRQMQGRYKVNHPVLKQLFDKAKLLTESFHLFRIEHVLREKNKDADRLVNEVLDRQAKR